MNYEAYEMAENALINLENLGKLIPNLEAHPFYVLTKEQLTQCIQAFKKEEKENPELSDDYCELCHDTGYYSDIGPGRDNSNREYVPCDCDPVARDRRQYKRRAHYEKAIE